MSIVVLLIGAVVASCGGDAGERAALGTKEQSSCAQDPNYPCLRFEPEGGYCNMYSDVQPTSACADLIRIDDTTSLPFARQIDHIYNGSTAIQFYVYPGKILDEEVAVVTGVIPQGATNGAAVIQPASGDYADNQYGLQWSEYATGRFYFAVNGGVPIKLAFAKMGYFTAYRTVNPERNRVTDLGTIDLVPDQAGTTITAGASSWQVVNSAVETDTYKQVPASRSATLFIPPNTVWESSRGPVFGDVEIAVKEYTVGDGVVGAQRMPAELPGTSAYTYAAEFVAKQWGSPLDRPRFVDTNGFLKPMFVYVENFLDLPAAPPHCATLPSGYYDPQTGAWIQHTDASAQALNGQAVTFQGIDPVTGAMQVESCGLTIPLDERQQLAARYLGDASTKSYWRIPITHFTPWDFNLGWWPPSDAKQPPEPQVEQTLAESCSISGTTIECEDRILGEEIPIAGTPYSLVYRSSRVPGFKPSYSVKIKLPGTAGNPALPESAQKLLAELEVAGLKLKTSVDKPAGGWANDVDVTIDWDGKDFLGRALNGSQPATLKLGAVYPGATYGQTNGFGLPPVGQYATNPTKQEVTYWTTWKGYVGFLNAQALRMGGWTFSHQHIYDRNTEIIHYGWGGWRRATPLGQRLHEVCPGCSFGSWVMGIDFAKDGSLYFVDRTNGADGVGALKRLQGSTITTLSTALKGPTDVKVGPDGLIYVAELGGNRICRYDPATQLVQTFMGTGSCGGVAGLTSALNRPEGVAVAMDGTVFVADTQNHRVVRRGPDGAISDYAGTNNVAGDQAGPGGMALGSKLQEPRGVDVAPDGSVVFTDRPGGFGKVKRVTASGQLEVIAGGGTDSIGEGVAATSARLSNSTRVRIGPDGALYFSEWGATQKHRVRKITASSKVVTVGGNGVAANCVDGGALHVSLTNPDGIAFATDGSLWIGQHGNTGCKTVRRLAPAVLGSVAGNFLVPSEDGSEVYEFDVLGRHQRTLDAVLGTERFRFRYLGYETSPGRYQELPWLVHDVRNATDWEGLTTVLQRHSDGTLDEIRGPYAGTSTQTTDVSIVNGWLTSVTAPGGLWAHGMTHDATTGLLTTFVDPKGTHSFSYDSKGRLETDRDAKTLTGDAYRTLTKLADTTTVTTPAGLSLEFERKNLTQGIETRRIRHATGMEVLAASGATCSGNDCTVLSSGQGIPPIGGARVALYADGSTRTAFLKPDPRLGLAAGTTEETLQLPDLSEKKLIVAVDRTVSGPTSGLFTFTALTETRTVKDTPAATGNTWTSQFIKPDPGMPYFLSTSPAQRKRRATIDAWGRVVNEKFDHTSPEAADVDYTWDWKGRLESITQGSRRVRYHYSETDGYLALVAVGTPDGPDVFPYLMWRFTPDAAGRVVETEQAGEVTKFGWDGISNLISVQTPTGGGAWYTHSLPHDSVNLLDFYNPPDVAGVQNDVVDYTFDNDRRVTEISWADGRKLKPEYEAGTGLLTRYRNGPGTELRAFTYDTFKRPDTASANGVTTNFGYSAFNVLPTMTTTTWPAGGGSKSVTLGYDGFLRVNSELVSTSQETATYFFDADNLVTSVSMPAGVLNLIATPRSPQSGRITKMSLGNVATTISYDPTYGDVTQVLAQYSGGADRFRLVLTPDAIGRVEEKKETVNAGATVTNQYTFDAAGRLWSATRGGTTTSWQYDARGNRTHQNGILVGTYDAQDRQLTWSASGASASFGHDDDGRRTTRTVSGVTTHYYAWDEFEQLTSVTMGSTVIQYTHDALGRRVTRKKIVSGVTQSEERYVYAEGNRLVALIDAAGNVSQRYIYATSPHVPDVVVIDGVAHWNLTDHLGSPRALVKASDGAVVFQADHDAWGKELSASGPRIPFGFAGGLYDPDTGLVHLGAREYDPETGRWLTKDPIRFDGGTNLYEYAASDPVNLVDVDGTHPVLWLAASPWGRAATGAVAGFATEFALSALHQLAENGGQFDCVNWNAAVTAGAIGAGIGGVSAFYAPAVATAVGPLKQWIRVGPSYSKTLGAPIELSIRWGASPARGGKYVKQIGSPALQRLNQWLRVRRLPGGSWRVQDPGHFHLGPKP